MVTRSSLDSEFAAAHDNVVSFVQYLGRPVTGGYIRSVSLITLHRHQAITTDRIQLCLARRTQKCERSDGHRNTPVSIRTQRIVPRIVSCIPALGNLAKWMSRGDITVPAPRDDALAG